MEGEGRRPKSLAAKLAIKLMQRERVEGNPEAGLRASLATVSSTRPLLDAFLFDLARLSCTCSGREHTGTVCVCVYVCVRACVRARVRACGDRQVTHGLSEANDVPEDTWHAPRLCGPPPPPPPLHRGGSLALSRTNTH